MQSPSISSKADIKFRNIGDKLIVEKVDVTLQMGDGVIDTKTSLEYQEIKDISFP